MTESAQQILKRLKNGGPVKPGEQFLKKGWNDPERLETLYQQKIQAKDFDPTKGFVSVEGPRGRAIKKAYRMRLKELKSNPLARLGLDTTTLALLAGIAVAAYVLLT